MVSTAVAVTAEVDLLDPKTWVRSTNVVPDVASRKSLEALGWKQNASWTWEEGNAVELANGTWPLQVKLQRRSVTRPALPHMLGLCPGDNMSTSPLQVR